MGREIEPDVFNDECPARQALALVADRWSLLVLLALLGGPKRHGLLRRKIGGISQKMLTQTLRRLERDGIVARTELPGRVVAVEYALTPLGQTLSEPVRALSAWAERNAWALEDIRQGQGDAMQA